MKKVIYILYGSLLFSSCMNYDKSLTGYVVYKEFTPEHMSNESPVTQHEAIIVPTMPHPVPPHRVDQEWRIWLANKDGVSSFKVDSSYYTHVKCGEKLTLKFE